MKNIKFEVFKLYDTSRQENFYEVHWADTGEFQKTTFDGVIKEIERICLLNNAEAVINYSPNRTLYVDSSDPNSMNERSLDISDILFYKNLQAQTK